MGAIKGVEMDKIKKADISLYLDALPDSECERLIREFHKGFALKEVIEGVVSNEDVNSYRSDDLLVAKDIHMSDHERWDTMNARLHSQYVLPVLRDYLQDYKFVLESESGVDPRSCIISLYERDKGHFCPHKDFVAGVDRSLTIICYLNTVMCGGSTYFFNQDFRVQPRRGSIVVFPSNFVYGHVGETPRSGDKYITVSFANVDLGNQAKETALLDQAGKAEKELKSE